jgi:hypothetical protein
MKPDDIKISIGETGQTISLVLPETVFMTQEAYADIQAYAERHLIMRPYSRVECSEAVSLIRSRIFYLEKQGKVIIRNSEIYMNWLGITFHTGD